MSLEGWGYRKPHVISGVDLADYPVKIRVYRTTGSDSEDTVYIGDKCREDFGDIRFTSSDKVTELHYWIEAVETTYADIWINATIVTDGSTIYVYYDNADATTTSSGDDTFEFFDDFSGETLDTEKWEGVLRTPEVIAGELVLSEYNERVKSVATGGLGHSMRTRIKTSAKKSYTYFGATNAGDGITSAPAAVLFFGDSTSASQARSRVNTSGTSTQTTSLPFTAGVYGIYEISRLSGSSNKFYVNDVLFATHVAPYVPDTVLPWTFQNLSSQQTVYVDWVLVRGISAIEPTHGDWGEEEMVVAPFEFVSKYHLACVRATFTSVYGYDGRVGFISRYAIGAIATFTSKYDITPGKAFTSTYRVLVSKDFKTCIIQGAINKVDFRTRVESAQKTIAAMFEER